MEYTEIVPVDPFGVSIGDILYLSMRSSEKRWIDRRAQVVELRDSGSHLKARVRWLDSSKLDQQFYLMKLDQWEQGKDGRIIKAEVTKTSEPTIIEQPKEGNAMQFECSYVKTIDGFHGTILLDQEIVWQSDPLVLDTGKEANPPATQAVNVAKQHLNNKIVGLLA